MVKRRGSVETAAKIEHKRPKGETARSPRGAGKGEPPKGAMCKGDVPKGPMPSPGVTNKRPRAPIGATPKAPRRSVGKGAASNGPKNVTEGTPKVPRKAVVKGQATKGPAREALRGPGSCVEKAVASVDPVDGQWKEENELMEVQDVFEDKKPPLKKSNRKVPCRRNTKVESKPGNVVTALGETGKKKAKPRGKQKMEDENNEIPCKLQKMLPDDAHQEKDVSVKEESDSESSDEDEDWEEVAEINEPALDACGVPTLPELPLPSKPVEIEIETPELVKKRERREKKKAEFQAYLRRMMNRFNKDVREDTHKVHLLCLLANGIYRNRVCSLPDLQAVALSIIPDNYTKQSTARVDLFFLSNLVKWFIAAFTLTPELSADGREPLQSTLESRLGIFCARNEEEMVHVFLIILRSLQLLCRLVLSLQPIPLKQPSAKEKKTSSGKSSSGASGEKGSAAKANKATSRKSAVRQGRKKVKTLSDDDRGEEDGDVKSEKLSSPGSKRTADEIKLSKGVKSLKCLSDGESKVGVKEGMPMPKNQRRRTVASKVSYKDESMSEESSDSDFLLSDTEDSTSSETDYGSSFQKKRRSSGSQSLKVNVARRGDEGSTERNVAAKSLDKPKPSEVKLPPADTSKDSKKRSKIISSDEEEMEVTIASRGMDQWVEVFLERENRWVCVDCIHNTINKPQLCYKAATKPMTYVVGIDNDGCVKDVTQRYDAIWMTSTRKRRVDAEWWEETLEAYKSPFTEREKKENQELQATLLEKPLPTSIVEFKNHPLYVLKRHLLKYEAIYPESATILGYCKGEAVYSRECVHTLHSKDTWLKEARVVALGELPYKMVKGQSNRARKARLADPENSDRDDLPLYGLWQTEDYQPPVAVGGKVPRNEYGNVYLFKPSMLPIGCSHLHVPNLHRVARKLNIDCVPAVTGFDFHCGFSHPVTEGYIVCEEFQEVLLDAWNIEQTELEKKENEKREKRVYGNWKLLIKGLLIRERLKQRYGAKEEAAGSNLQGGAGFSSDEEEKPSSEKPTSETPAQDATASWPQNRQAEEQSKGKPKRTTKREKKAEATHLFPFEKL
ncbi:hypothetical protein NDU88_008092 [Pleurodeles waltl]|uniref:DNA repair protein complementing XP-C cells n=1 Tax=Pleurodeles waltl TaxID=8319 RepID=A0AAV7N3Z2_PLEWA|nr:hypothetical protein NDU88_008092 [Pleurodeles waltl]